MGHINSFAVVPIAWKVCTSPLKASCLGVKNLVIFSKLVWKTLIDLSFVHGFLRTISREI